MKQMQTIKNKLLREERERNNVSLSNVIATFAIIVVIDAATTAVYQLSEHARNSTKKNAISTPRKSRSKVFGFVKKKRHSSWMTKWKVDFNTAKTCKNWSTAVFARALDAALNWIRNESSCMCKRKTYYVEKYLCLRNTCKTLPFRVT